MVHSASKFITLEKSQFELNLTHKPMQSVLSYQALSKGKEMRENGLWERKTQKGYDKARQGGCSWAMEDLELGTGGVLLEAIRWGGWGEILWQGRERVEGPFISFHSIAWLDRIDAN